MVENKKLEDLLGERILSIKALNDESKNANNMVQADIIFIRTEHHFIEIVPITDSDELDWNIYKGEPEKFKNCTSIDNISLDVNSKLNYTWFGTNTNGYSDLIAFALNSLKPSLIILCEGSVLKLFHAQQF